MRTASANQACSRLTTGAEQRVENAVALNFRECLTVDALGDGPEKVIHRLTHGGRELKGNPLADFPQVRAMWVTNSS